MSDENPWSEVVILLLLVFLNAFFSLSEMAIVSSRKSRLKAKADAGKKAFIKAYAAASNPARYLSTVQIGITLIGVLAGAFGGATVAKNLESAFARLPTLAPYAQVLGMGIVVLATTIITILLGELVPKRIALAQPEIIAAAVVPVLDVVAKLFMPLVAFLSKTSGFILKLLRVPPADHSITEEELKIALLEGERSGIVERKERDMVEGVFYLGDRPVETFMTHRSDLTWLEGDADEASVRAAALDSREGVLLVAEGSLDAVIGCVATIDILAALVRGQWPGLKALMRQPCFVPGTMSAVKAFEAYKSSGSRVLLIMDEYGGLAGILPIRDLMEEIVGELSVTDQGDQEIVKRDDGSYLIGGSVNIDEFADLFNIGQALPEHRDFHTLAGLILKTAGSIPKTGERVDWNGFRLEIVDMDGNRIDKVLVTPSKDRI